MIEIIISIVVGLFILAVLSEIAYQILETVSRRKSIKRYERRHLGHSWYEDRAELRRKYNV